MIRSLGTRLALAALASAVAVPLALVQPGQPTPAGASTPAITWLAAGDSFASGQGLLHPAGKCARGTGTGGSGSAWAIAAAAALRKEGVKLASGSPDLVACTGAISDQFFHADGSPTEPQWHKGTKPYDLVTFSFGGDDIQFKSTITQCTLVAHECAPANTERNKITELGSTGDYVLGIREPGFPAFLNNVAKTAVVTGGNVVVMGYPDIFENPLDWSIVRDVVHPTCSDFYPDIVDRLRGWGGDLNATLGEAVLKADAEPAAQRNGVHFTFINPTTGGGLISPNDANLFEPATGTHHELCSKGGQPWVNGFSIHRSHSYHPNQAGENAMGALAAEVVPHLTWPWSTAPSGPAATTQTTVPVQVCPTTDGGPSQGTPQPESIPARTSLAGLGPMTAYTDTEGIGEILAPTGWGCDAFIGADGTTGIYVWPPGAPPGQQNSTVSDGINAFVYPGANIGGQYDLTCALFGAADNEIGQGQGPCPTTVPSGETDSTLKSDVIAFDDPPGVDGSWDNSSGSFSANGVLIYDYGGLVANTTTEEAACLLPASDKSLCTASLDDFIAHYAHPVPGATASVPTTEPTTGTTGTTGNTGANTGSTGASGNS